MIKKNVSVLLHSPHISEKSTFLTKKSNTVVLRVSKNASKHAIKDTIYKLFSVHILDVRTLLVKGKIKRHGKYFGRCSGWKKAYVTFKKGEVVDFICGKE